MRTESHGHGVRRGMIKKEKNILLKKELGQDSPLPQMTKANLALVSFCHEVALSQCACLRLSDPQGPILVRVSQEQLMHSPLLLALNPKTVLWV